MMSTSESLLSVARESAYKGLAGCFPPSLCSSLWAWYPSILPTWLLLPPPALKGAVLLNGTRGLDLCSPALKPPPPTFASPN